MPLPRASRLAAAAPPSKVPIALGDLPFQAGGAASLGLGGRSAITPMSMSATLGSLSPECGLAGLAGLARY